MTLMWGSSMAFWNKRIKSVGKTALDLGEEKEKVKALKEGDLEIGGKTMDRVLKTLEEDKIQGLIKKNEIWKWIQETDFRKLRESFGYSSQREVAKLIPCDTSIICNLENHKEKFKMVSPKLMAIYDFYNNDFNKKIKRGSIKVYSKDLSNKSGFLTKEDKEAVLDTLMEYEKTGDITLLQGNRDYNVKDVSKKTKKEIEKEKKAIFKWYKKTNIRELRKSKGYDNLYDLVKPIGVSQSCLSDLELKHFKRVNKTMTNAYYFFNGKQEELEEVKNVDLDAIYEWYKGIKDLHQFRRDFGYSLNTFMSTLNLSYDQARTFERHDYKSATPIVKKIYDFYHDESNRKKPIVWEPNDNNTYVANKKEEPTKEVKEFINSEVKSRFEKNIIEGRYEDPIEETEVLIEETKQTLANNEKDKLIESLTKENGALKRQIATYEKLISMIQ